MNDQVSRLVAFYRGGLDDAGRRLADILRWDTAALESTHDYIQWLFPLRERSRATPTAPVLSAADVRIFRTDAAMQQRMRDALAVMCAFYGFSAPTDVRWLEPGNHNYLRLTRILRSLRTVGLEAEARRLFATLTDVYRDHQAAIGTTTYEYWQRATTDDLER
jgi:Opioid growth factor receptor (OGFr) conserved region